MVLTGFTKQELSQYTVRQLDTLQPLLYEAKTGKKQFMDPAEAFRIAGLEYRPHS